MSELESNRRKSPEARFTRFRIHYLIVHVAIMLADGLQGTHLYVLYESYGYSVASLYSLGFLTGAITSPLIGPSVDYFGRRKSALLYCALEMLINSLEVFDNIYGLIISRMIGGITTNLLFCVFESWLITEHRRLKFSEDKLEILMRDSVVASNLSAIISGMLAHVLAMNFGNAGPFQGAVLCTALAFCLVTRWEENYGGMKQHKEHQQDAHEYTKSNDDPQNQADSNESSVVKFMVEAFKTIISDYKICRVGIIQGLTEGALQTFVFLWSPALRYFAKLNPESCASGPWGVVTFEGSEDTMECEPAYGLIFGAFMAVGVLGGLCEPFARKYVSRWHHNKDIKDADVNARDGHETWVSCGPPTVEAIAEFEALGESDGNMNRLKPAQSELFGRLPSCTPTDISSVAHSSEADSDGDYSNPFDQSKHETMKNDKINEEDSSSSLCSVVSTHGELTDSFISRSDEVMKMTKCDSFCSIENDEHSQGTELFLSISFIICAVLLATPMLARGSLYAFPSCLLAFLMYEFMVGLYLPLDGMIRSIYIPNESICSVHTMLRVLVNLAVAMGVFSTNYIEITTAFVACSVSMIVAAMLMYSLVNKDTHLRKSPIIRSTDAKQKLE